MNRNEAQGRWLIDQGFITQALAHQAFQESESRPGLDLCAVLLRRGAIDAAVAEQARRSAEATRRFRSQATLEEGPRVNTGQTLADGNARTDTTLQLGDTQTDTPEDQPPIRVAEERSPVHQSSRIVMAPPGLQRWGEYTLLKELGRGGIGRVFLARHEPSQGMVALKAVPGIGRSPVRTGRFRREVKTLFKLDHPNIVKIFDCGQHEDFGYYAMEAIDGQDLEASLLEALKGEGRLPAWDELIPILRGLAQGLRHCHERGIVHRDIKPQNILLEKASRRVVLVDFGLTRKDAALESGSLSSDFMTRSGALVGTPAYMAPEQIDPQSKESIGPHTDIWAFGATLFFVLTGIPPYNHPSLAATIDAILNDPVPRPKDINPAVPSALDELCRRCLNKSADKRPTIQDVLASLDAPPRRSSKISRKRPEKRPRRSALLPALAALLLTAGVAAFLILRPAPDARFRELSIDPSGPLTRENALRILGRSDQAGAKVIVQAAPLTCDERGYFSRLLELDEGPNRIVVGILNAGGLEHRREFHITRDSTPPRIVWDHPSSAKGALQIGDAPVLSGRVIDAHPDELFIDGERISCDPDGRFRYELTADIRSETLQLRAIDRAQNVREKAVTIERPEGFIREPDHPDDRFYASIYQPKRGFFEGFKPRPSRPRPGPEAIAQRGRELFETWRQITGFEDPAWAVLADLETWTGAEQAAQDKAIALAAAKLGPSYRFVETRVFECQGARHRLGVFRHQATGLELVLLPGHSLWFSWWQSPIAESTVSIYRSVAAGVLEPRALSYILGRTLLTEPLAQQIFRSFPELAEGIERLPGRQRLARIYRFFSAEERREPFQEALQELCDLLEASAPIAERVEYAPPFLIGRSEVSIAAWNRFREGPAVTGKGELPVSRISAREAGLWLRRAGGGLRLPTRVEWRYAADAGTRHAEFYGDTIIQRQEYVWTVENLKGEGPQPAARHAEKANAFGLIDSLGNIDEWVNPMWLRWREVWLEESEDKALIEGLYRRYSREQNLSKGGHFFRPGALCRSRTVKFRPGDRGGPQFGLRVARSLADPP